MLLLASSSALLIIEDNILSKAAKTSSVLELDALSKSDDFTSSLESSYFSFSFLFFILSIALFYEFNISILIS